LLAATGRTRLRESGICIHRDFMVVSF
jgi:hypothetical protein